jgi:hypothetical protein
MILTRIEYRLDAHGTPSYVHLAYQPSPQTLTQLETQHNTLAALVHTLLVASGEPSFQEPAYARIEDKMGHYTFFRSFTACSAPTDSKRVFARVATQAPTARNSDSWLTRVSLEGLAEELARYEAHFFPEQFSAALLPAVKTNAHELQSALHALRAKK